MLDRGSMSRREFWPKASWLHRSRVWTHHFSWPQKDNSAFFFLPTRNISNQGARGSFLVWVLENKHDRDGSCSYCELKNAGKTDKPLRFVRNNRWTKHSRDRGCFASAGFKFHLTTHYMFIESNTNMRLLEWLNWEHFMGWLPSTY